MKVKIVGLNSPPKVKISMSLDEAVTLLALARSVAGRQDGRRGQMDKLARKLYEAGVPLRADCVACGVVHMKD